MFTMTTAAVRCLFSLVCMVGLALPVWAQHSDAEQLSEAARRGDAAKVKALLEKGVDVNTKFRYDVTALSFACDRGHLEVVKVLLEHGADVNVKDTFYQATPIFWATSPAYVDEPTENHVQIVRLLLEKGAQGREDVLIQAARSGRVAMIEMLLEVSGLKPESLSTALAAATRNKHDSVAEKLRAAGAIPPPAAVFQVDAATLARYAGTYKSDTTELVFAVKDGKLFVTPAGQVPIGLGALDQVTFVPDGIDDVSVKFQIEGNKVTGFILKQGTNETSFERVEIKEP